MSIGTPEEMVQMIHGNIGGKISLSSIFANSRLGYSQGYGVGIENYGLQLQGLKFLQRGIVWVKKYKLIRLLYPATKNTLNYVNCMNNWLRIELMWLHLPIHNYTDQSHLFNILKLNCFISNKDNPQLFVWKCVLFISLNVTIG